MRRVVVKATAPEPSDRYASAQDFLAALQPIEGVRKDVRYHRDAEPLQGSWRHSWSPTPATSTAGLQSSKNSLRYSLHTDFLAVIGPSGIGKSSVVRAGLLPALRQGRFRGSEDWLITDMLPGSHPFRELERSLERVVGEISPIELRERLANQDSRRLPAPQCRTAEHTKILLGCRSIRGALHHGR